VFFLAGKSHGFRFVVIVEALLRGVNDGQDILTLSLGGACGWTEGTASVVSSRIASNGKIVTIAAGNDASYTPIICGLFKTFKEFHRVLLDRGSPPGPETALT